MKQQLLFLCLSLFFFNVNAQVMIDCSAGPITEDFCYGNNNTTFFTYTSTDGSPLTILFNNGQIEGENFDYLIVYDTDGTEIYNGVGNYGDLTGLTFQSTGDTISFTIDSDGTLSCQSGTGSLIGGINFSVACATCINSTVTFTPYADCDNADQYLVQTDITGLGSAESLTISNTINSNTIQVTQVGVYQAGPFPLGTPVVVTVNNEDDLNCTVNSSTLNIEYCPPPNDEPCNAISVAVNSDSCDQFSTGTLLGATASQLPVGSCTGSPNDDVWFKFTASYDTVRISILNITNGSTNIDHALYQGTCNGLTEIYCSSYTNSATPVLVVGDEYFIRVFSSESINDSTIFDVCIQKAPSNIVCEQATPFCSSGGGLLTDNLIGIAGIGQIACLGSTPNPSWNIIQIGQEGIIEVEIEQTNSSNLGLDVDFVLWGPFASVDSACSNIDFMDCPGCPNNNSDPNFYPFNDIIDCSYSSDYIENFTIDNAQSGEIYILLVTNYSDSSGIISITQTNIGDPNAGTIIGDFEIDLGPDRNICNSSPNTALNAYSPFADTYDWYKDGIVLTGENESNLVVSESGNYSVIGYNENCAYTAIDDIVVNFIDCDNAGLITINAFYDTNANSIFDTGEHYFSNGYFTYEINGDGNTNFVSSSTGTFNLASFEDTNSYDFAYYFYNEFEDCFDVTTLNYENISVTNGSEITVDFPIVEDQSCEDIAVYLMSGSAPRPGFNTTNYLSIKNLGLVATSGSVEFIADSNFSYNSVSGVNPNYTVTPTANGFILGFVDLQPGFSSNVLISLTCLNATPLGTYVNNTAAYITASNDTVLENNTSSVTEEVVGSYDPNDIMEAHGPQIVYSDFVNSDGYLYYLIRFQNIGTAEAIDVRIEDVLDSQLDESTFQILRSSHDNVVIRTYDQLVWQFEGINLPSQSMDEQGSKGYVYFRIKPLDGYAIGDVIPNVANIYFDFNAPITTNVFNTEFVETLSVNSYETASFGMYPNPANSLVTLHFNSYTDGLVTVFDVQGKTILNAAVEQMNKIELEVAAFESGLYFVKFNNGSNEITKKLIIE